MIIRVRHLLWLAVMFGLVQMTSAEWGRLYRAVGGMQSACVHGVWCVCVTAARTSLARWTRRRRRRSLTSSCITTSAGCSARRRRSRCAASCLAICAVDSSAPSCRPACETRSSSESSAGCRPSWSASTSSWRTSVHQNSPSVHDLRSVTRRWLAASDVV